MCKISPHSKTYSLQNQLFLGSYSWVINFVNMYSNGKLYARKLWHSYGKVGFWMSIGAVTTNVHQQNPCMTSGIILVTNPYYTIYYLLYQELFTVCAYL